MFRRAPPPPRPLHAVLNAATLLTLAAGVAAAQAPTPALTLTRVPDTATGTDALELVGDIPIDGAFAVRYAAPPGTRTAILEVWPRAIQPDCDGETPPYDAPQTHVVEMTLAPSGARTWANATVPHLQVDRAFCFRVRSTESIPLPPSAAAGLVAASVASDRIDDPGPWAAALAERALGAACRAVGAEGVDCRPELWQAALERRLVARLLGSPLPLARATRTTVERARQTAEKVARALRARAAQLPPGPYDPTTALQMPLPELIAARDAVAASGQSMPWRAWLTEYVAVAERLQFESARQEAAEQAVLDAQAALVPVIEAEIADFLSSAAHAERLSPAARGSARTRDANNFITPVYGIALGLPAHGGPPWLFTYAGVHIFFEPVERSIPFDALVGSRMAQRLSIFVGALTSEAGRVDRARVTPGLGGAYPGLGLGWRVTQHIALDAIAILYTATDDDPLSDRQTLGATGALGLTAELDIVQWLTPN